MASIETLFRFDETEAKDLFDALHEFFTAEKWSSYEPNTLMNEAEKEAVFGLFDDSLTLEERVEEALKKDPLCLEALYIDYKLADDIDVYDDLERIYKMRGELEGFSDYHRFAFFVALSMYADYLFSITNITKAIKVLEFCCENSHEYTRTNILRLAYMYTGIEDGRRFFDLFLKVGFSDPLVYVLLLVTLLKNEMSEEAKEVLEEFVSAYPFAAYLDRPYELDEIDNDDAGAILDALDNARELIAAVPFFFDWCHDHMSTGVAKA